MSAHAHSCSDHDSHTTIDHDEVRKWAEQRGGKPTCVRGTGGGKDIGLLRIEFPGYRESNNQNLEQISWEEFFQKFDDQKLALLCQEKTGSDAKNNFNKLVSREDSGIRSKRNRKDRSQ